MVITSNFRITNFPSKISYFFIPLFGENSSVFHHPPNENLGNLFESIKFYKKKEDFNALYDLNNSEKYFPPIIVSVTVNIYSICMPDRSFPCCIRIKTQSRTTSITTIETTSMPTKS